MFEPLELRTAFLERINEKIINGLCKDCTMYNDGKCMKYNMVVKKDDMCKSFRKKQED